MGYGPQLHQLGFPEPQNVSQPIAQEPVQILSQAVPSVSTQVTASARVQQNTLQAPVQQNTSGVGQLFHASTSHFTPISPTPPHPKKRLFDVDQPQDPYTRYNRHSSPAQVTRPEVFSEQDEEEDEYNDDYDDYEGEEEDVDDEDYEDTDIQQIRQVRQEMDAMNEKFTGSLEGIQRQLNLLLQQQSGVGTQIPLPSCATSSGTLPGTPSMEFSSPGSLRIESAVTESTKSQTARSARRQPRTQEQSSTSMVPPSVSSIPSRQTIPMQPPNPPQEIQQQPSAQEGIAAQFPGLLFSGINECMRRLFESSAEAPYSWPTLRHQDQTVHSMAHTLIPDQAQPVTPADTEHLPPTQLQAQAMRNATFKLQGRPEKGRYGPGGNQPAPYRPEDFAMISDQQYAKLERQAHL